AQQINEVFGDNPTSNRFIKKVRDFKNEDFIFTAANFYGSKKRKAKLQRCAFCSGPTRKRTLDDPEIIKVRLKEFADRTYPIIEGMESRGYTVKRIDGLPAPYKVHESVMKVLGISQ
ncbi:hypothetical protein LCGC14_1672620, partial [marine sediment metagenome]